MNLYELSEEYASLCNLLAETDPEADVAQAIKDTLESAGLSLADKLERCAYVVKTLDAEADELAEEIKRLQARKSARDNGADILKAAMLSAMQTAGVAKLKTAKWTIYPQKNNPAVVIAEGVTIDARWWKPQDPVLDKAGLSNALKAGEKVEGASLVTTVSLRIR